MRGWLSGNAAALAAFSSALARVAHAGNEDEIFVGNTAPMLGGALISTVADGSSLWYNPAGLGGVDRSAVDVTSSVYSLRLFSAKGYLRSAQGEEQDLSVAEFVAVPVQISYVRPLSETTSIGFGYFQPHSSKLIVNTSLATATGDVTGDLSVDAISEYAQYAFGAALGITPRPGLRLGFGGFLRWDSLVQSVNIFSAVYQGASATQITHVGEIRTQDLVGIEPLAGLQWDATPRLTLGVNVRGPRLTVYNRGSTGTRTGIATVDPQQVIADISEDDISQTEFGLARLGRYYAGFAYRWDHALLSADADFQPAYTDASAGIHRRWTWNARIGFSYDLAPHLSVGGGVFTDRSATDEQEGTLISRGGNFLGGSVGVRLTKLHLLAASEPRPQLEFSTLFALRYAYARAHTESLLVDPTQDDTVQVLDITDARISVHEIAVYVGSGVDF